MSIAGVLFITRGPNKQFKYSFQFEMVRKSTEKFNHKIRQKNDHTIHKKNSRSTFKKYKNTTFGIRFVG